MTDARTQTDAHSQHELFWNARTCSKIKRHVGNIMFAIMFEHKFECSNQTITHSGKFEHARRWNINRAALTNKMILERRLLKLRVCASATLQESCSIINILIVEACLCLPWACLCLPLLAFACLGLPWLCLPCLVFACSFKKC